ncbi:AMP-binding enzyme-like protein 21 [Elsinoe fawcettii]|nr:AMP-binding enzyme-like protein 21 [Elsinoe fawcettii]
MTGPSTAVRLQELLENAASHDSFGIILYGDGITDTVHLSYDSLLNTAKQNARLLIEDLHVHDHSIILLHFDNHLDNIIWSWSVVLAGARPCMSTPLVKDEHGRLLHLQHLHSLLIDPLVLTSQRLIESDFNYQSNPLRLVSIDVQPLSCHRYLGGDLNLDVPIDQRQGLIGNAALLMLTSGSTGNAKAVCLSEHQLITACRGKPTHLPLPNDSTILNWIPLDHVGSLVELHLVGLLALAHQVYVPAAVLVQEPLQFLRLLSKHRVARTFAPNFFLHRLLEAVKTATPADLENIKLAYLLYIISGGEANDVDLCVSLSAQLAKLRAPTATTITPGFGMTETCAGSIYKMRMSLPSADAADGELEVRGDIVFERYFNNPQATKQAFTSNGWFRTGDLALIDNQGVLRLTGRSKNIININGVKFLPEELEAAVERQAIPGVSRSNVLCFAHRPTEARTEQIHVLYQHDYHEEDVEARFTVQQAISRTVMLFAGARPLILPLPPDTFARTTLSKLSRSKIRDAYLDGSYDESTTTNTSMLDAYHAKHTCLPTSPTEQRIARLLNSLGFQAPNMGTESTILDSGISSVDFIRLKRAIEEEFGISDVPIVILMTNITVRTLADAISDLQIQPYKSAYNPVVTLQPHGTHTPLWLIHPGIGEMLVFLGLGKYFPDRPIHAMRARGLNAGEPVFSSLSEVLTTYLSAIKTKQPHGPYAIAGYSYGSMIAFELAKLLEQETPGSVRFLGSFNLPPHIKTRMQQLDWTARLVHIAHFCSIITEERSEELLPLLRPLEHGEQVRLLLAESDVVRCAELQFTQPNLHNWTDVSWSLQRIGQDYEPSGEVSGMDVFYCQPLKAVARTRREYRRSHLGRWVDFIRDDLRFWEVEGEHYTMIGEEHVGGFQRTLKRALEGRGL